MTNPGAEVLVGIPDIAEMARVGRTAVSNWRKRYADFPAPRLETPSGVLFDLKDVQSWLAERGKIDRPVSPEVVLWRLADRLRGRWTPTQLGDFLVGCLVFITACERAARPDASLTIPVAQTWTKLRPLPIEEMYDALLKAAWTIEDANPTLRGLLVPALAQEPRPESRHVAEILETIDLASRNDMGQPIELFEGVLARVQDFDRFAGELSTPSDLSHLMAQLAGPTDGLAFDPALGSAGLLLLWALESERDHARMPRLVGFDINSRAVFLARARFFLYDIDIDLSELDALRVSAGELPAADVVLLDPPYNTAGWGDADLYLDERWRFGPPPPKSADWAWMQLVHAALKPGGRGVVVLPAGDMSRVGREQLIRQAMLDAGAIEGVILLPSRIRRDTSIPLSVWLLRGGTTPDRQVEILLVDGSMLGTAGRSTHSLDGPAIDRLVQVVEEWRRTGRAPTSGEPTALSMKIENLVEADLNPRRYWLLRHPPQRPDIRAEADALRGDLAKAAEDASRATANLVDFLSRAK